MESTLSHAISTLATFGIDVDPDVCDPSALRADVDDIREGITPLHMETLPPRYAQDLMLTIADMLEAR